MYEELGSRPSFRIDVLLHFLHFYPPFLHGSRSKTFSFVEVSPPSTAPTRTTREARPDPPGHDGPPKGSPVLQQHFPRSMTETRHQGPPGQGARRALQRRGGAGADRPQGPSRRARPRRGPQGQVVAPCRLGRVDKTWEGSGG